MIDMPYKILYCLDEHTRIQCLNCRCKFTCDPHDEENLVFDRSTQVLLPRCPQCKTIFGVNSSVDFDFELE